jgi:hypothetical protein
MNQETQNTQAQTKESRNPQGLFANPKVFISQKNETIIHFLIDEIRLEMPINLYKKILSIPYSSKEKVASNQPAKTTTFGLVARPAIYLSQDGQFLIHRVLGLRISKHVNYYKKILGAEFESKKQSA